MEITKSLTTLSPVVRPDLREHAHGHNRTSPDRSLRYRHEAPYGPDERWSSGRAEGTACSLRSGDGGRVLVPDVAGPFIAGAGAVEVGQWAECSGLWVVDGGEPVVGDLDVVGLAVALVVAAVDGVDAAGEQVSGEESVGFHAEVVEQADAGGSGRVGKDRGGEDGEVVGGGVGGSAGGGCVATWRWLVLRLTWIGLWWSMIWRFTVAMNDYL